MANRPDPYGNADRFERNESDGMGFFGYDCLEDHTTTWYDEFGNLDSITPIPDDDEWW